MWRRWLAVLMLGIWSSAYAQDNPQGEQPGARTTAQQAVAEQAQLPVLQNEPARPKPYQSTCKAPKDRDEADLCAQERMAIAAENMLDMTNRQNWLTGAEAILLAITIFFTAWAARAASKAANSADAAVIVTRDIGEAQLRAYVHVTTAQLNLQPHDPRLRVKIKNTGQTSALNVKIGIWHEVEWVGSAYEYRTVPKQHWDNPTGVLAPGIEDSFDIRYKTVNRIEDTYRRGGPEMADTYRGYVIYNDIFGSTYQSDFVFYIKNPVATQKILLNLAHVTEDVPAYVRIENPNKA